MTSIPLLTAIGAKMDRSILVVDDQDLALKQVVVNFPPVQKNDVLFRHVDSIAAFDRGRR